MRNQTVEKIYAGWLGKLIGVRLGAPVEMWDRQRIEETYHGQHGYLADYNDFAADDDTNGPTFFIRALRDSGKMAALTSRDVGRAWLQYAAWGQGMYWWGGYGVSSEHTAYEHLRAGLPAPQSGSSETNGKVLSEQIGGQIFIDAWGLVCPGCPQEAARLAGLAARVAHDGEAVIGGRFVAACIAAAFDAVSVDDMLNRALACIQEDSRYARCVRDVRSFHQENPDDPSACYAWIHEHCWRSQWRGSCHILPNAALMILSLCYGEGNFSKTLELCNQCGFDTDCNAGNVGTMMGVLNGLEGIDACWRAPINDYYVCSSVLGSLNITDAASFARQLCRLAADMGHFLPSADERAWLDGRERVSFFLPGSTCGVRVTRGQVTAKGAPWKDGRLCISTEGKSGRAWLFTYIQPCDLFDDRYQPTFSPLCYPGQTASAVISARGRARFFLEDSGGKTHASAWHDCRGDTTLTWTLPDVGAQCICKLGVDVDGCGQWQLVSLDWQGDPSYRIQTAALVYEQWNPCRAEIRQFTRVKGHWYLENGRIVGAGHDLARAFTGGETWQNYTVRTTLTFGTASAAALLARVGGAMRCCGAELRREGVVTVFCEDIERTVLQYVRTAPMATVDVTLGVFGQELTVWLDGQRLATVRDERLPVRGCIGLDVVCPGSCMFGDMLIRAWNGDASAALQREPLA